MKKIMTILLVCATALVLCACGGGGGKAVDLGELEKDLMNAGVFTDTMSPPAEGVAGRLYGFSDGDLRSFVLYTGTGATAEELFLAEAADGNAAKTLKTACETRLKNQKSAFENYAPGELVKLDGAVLAVDGSYVILVVSADPGAARAVVDSHIDS